VKAKLFALLMPFWFSFACADNLLIIIPTRENSQQFMQTLGVYYHYLSGEVDCRFLIVCDTDDQTMNNPEMLHQLSTYPGLTVKFGKRISEAEAFNRNDEPAEIILVASDCQFPIVQSYDKVIVDKMKENFPNLDGVLNFQAKDTGKNINTIPVIGKNHYAFFNYIFHPSYRSASVAREELTMTSRILAREVLIFQSLFEKVPSQRIKSRIKDVANVDYDKKVYLGRFNSNFGLNDAVFEQFLPQVWSILICTLDERVEQFSFIYNKLQGQINANDLQDRVEILFFKDNRQYSVGYKRNTLMRQSKGMYVNFIDDDDDVHDNYIKMIYEELQSKPDCVSLTGIITFNGNWPCPFVHTIQHKDHYKIGNTFYNPPNHISTIKRSVASRFPFPDISYGEDYNWAMQICHSGLLQTESVITTPYYFYRYVDK